MSRPASRRRTALTVEDVAGGSAWVTHPLFTALWPLAVRCRGGASAAAGRSGSPWAAWGLWPAGTPLLALRWVAAAVAHLGYWVARGAARGRYPVPGGQI